MNLVFNAAHLAQFHFAWWASDWWTFVTEVRGLGIINIPVILPVRNRGQRLFEMKLCLITGIAFFIFLSLGSAESLICVCRTIIIRLRCFLFLKQLAVGRK